MAQRQVVSVSVPQELREEMTKFPEENWSAVAQEAFRKRLSEPAAKQKGRSKMESAIERLRKSKEKAESEDHKLGLESGSTWAKEEAEWAELKALDRRFGDRDNPDLSRIWSDFSDYESLEAVAEAFDGERVDHRRVEEVWECLGYDDVNKISKEFVAAWIEGALEVYDNIKDRV